ncbi:hypothetical protein QYE76_046399 [Lolium multiflorum]|uniref:Uncharacterized protein n=1 Tax=Lolium multiflorum TaxID=4521 RepID=A0AAD8TNA7_LOLMU|nr:hypothetical protein QYE76_046399 [Lolium multiflorum]
MALAAWRSKNSTAEAAVQSRYFVLAGAVDGGRTPKGEPCMEGLLEMAAQQFGYGQQGVLRIPCDARQFHQMMVTVHGKSRS